MNSLNSFEFIPVIEASSFSTASNKSGGVSNFPRSSSPSQSGLDRGGGGGGGGGPVVAASPSTGLL